MPTGHSVIPRASAAAWFALMVRSLVASVFRSVNSATRDNPGTTCFSNSKRFPLRSTAMSEGPVALPPGRAKLSTNPKPTGSPARTNTIGNGTGELFELHCAKRCHCNNCVEFGIDKLARQYPEPFRIFGGKAMVQMNVLAFNVAEIVERFY